MPNSFLHYSPSSILVLSLLSVVIPMQYGIHIPRQVSPLFDEYCGWSDLQTIAAEKPQIVKAGDSIFKRGVNHKKLATETGKTVYGIGVAGPTGFNSK
jgi:hypothetical protein